MGELPGHVRDTDAKYLVGFGRIRGQSGWI